MTKLPVGVLLIFFAVVSACESSGNEEFREGYYSVETDDGVALVAVVKGLSSIDQGEEREEVSPEQAVVFYVGLTKCFIGTAAEDTFINFGKYVDDGDFGTFGALPGIIGDGNGGGYSGILSSDGNSTCAVSTSLSQEGSVIVNEEEGLRNGPVSLDVSFDDSTHPSYLRTEATLLSISESEWNTKFQNLVNQPGLVAGPDTDAETTARFAAEFCFDISCTP